MDDPIYKPEIKTSLFSPFLVAVQFLTVMPPLLKRPFTDQELGQAVGYYPLVGLLLGGVLVAANSALALLFPTALRIALLLALWVILTGVLHLDGFLDACDGLFGGWTPEKRLHIMRDERVGAFALAGGVLLLLTKYVALTTVAATAVSATAAPLIKALLIAPVLARWAMSLALIRYPYARTEGLGRTMKDMASGRELLLATGTAVLVALLVGGSVGVWALLAAVVTAVATAHFVMQRIPGLTGDIYGTICELTELVILLVFAAW
ncbi:MAG: adenosylcobinamide-GDP ribazoletransferase [Anaerolineales bacterium]|nr:adenosylcobinamide-GDP ribazoletransferase [Anaerolineales bacterium]